jgi:LDH2 family malate/lactate/ureidoglycolate dehydrogenase
MAGVARVGEERLKTFCIGILTAVGVPTAGARQVADCLVSANLQGVDTHGVARLSTYVRRIREGAVDARGQPRVISTHGAVALADGANALGPVAACFGMDIAIARARELTLVARSTTSG